MIDQTELPNLNNFLQCATIAITGGIGSGKTFVCNYLRQRGIDVYDCDDAAKRIMQFSADVRIKLCQLIGDEAYLNGHLNKSVVASFLLKGESCKQAVNEIVHPAVARDFELSGDHWFESAILFDSKFYKRIHIDYVVCVSAPINLRIARIVARDSISTLKAKEWISRQMLQDEVERLSDFVIVNDDNHDISRQIDLLLEQLDDIANNDHPYFSAHQT